MGSTILYNKNTLEILKCQRKPYGSSGMPSFKAICMSARIPEDMISELDICTINESLSTKDAKEKLRLINGEPLPKPFLQIKSNKVDVLKFKIIVEVKNKLESDLFDFVKMSINGVEFSIDLNNGIGNKIIEAEEPDKYIIKCRDDRFFSYPLEVVVVG
ncbi:MAG: hypothetical protein MI740_10545 [Halanaerobiales bacterium]|nr:hypothetical protein [Halanaerobiales bacterium]